MEEIVNAIIKLGFPVAVSIYLLTRQEKKMGELTDRILGKDGILDKQEQTLDKIVGKEGVFDKLNALIKALEKKKNAK